METCSVGHFINSSGKCRCDDIAKLAVCSICGEDCILAPEGWESNCPKHFPYTDLEKSLGRGETFYPLSELIYLEAMGVQPLYWLMNGRDNLHYLPADKCVVCRSSPEDADDDVRSDKANICAHCSQPMDNNRQDDRCSNGGLHVSIEEFEQLKGCDASDCASFVGEPCDCVTGGGGSQNEAVAPQAAAVTGKVHEIFLPILGNLMRPQDWQRAEEDRSPVDECEQAGRHVCGFKAAQP